MKPDGGAPVSDEDGALAAAADVLGIVAGRIKTTLESSGGTVTVGVPARRLAAAGDLSDGAEGRLQVTVHTADASVQFVLQLTAARSAAGLSPAEAPPATVAAS